MARGNVSWACYEGRHESCTGEMRHWSAPAKQLCECQDCDHEVEPSATEEEKRAYDAELEYPDPEFPSGPEGESLESAVGPEDLDRMEVVTAAASEDRVLGDGSGRFALRVSLVRVLAPLEMTDDESEAMYETVAGIVDRVCMDQLQSELKAFDRRLDVQVL